MLPCAYVVHQIPGRVRLRIREKCKDSQYFEELRRRLGSLSGVDEIRINSITGTILLLHSEQPYAQVADQLRQLRLFEITEGAESGTSALARLSSALATVDKAIAGSSGGSVDLRTLAYIGLMAFTVRQIIRGQVLGPALPMLWQALSLVGRIKGGAGDITPELSGQGDVHGVSEDGS
jgi:hypothetical protein